LIYVGTPKAKAVYRLHPDAEGRKRGDQTGLETQVVHALNDASYLVVLLSGSTCRTVKTLSLPPEEYSRKAETQRNSRGFIVPEEHAP